jgi:hypothetical protein
MKKLTFGTLLLALVAMLAVAATASAKGGGGGGDGASCAQILDFTSVPTTTADGNPAITTSYTVNNTCFDNGKSTMIAIDSLNNLTGFAARSVTTLPYGVSSTSSTAPAPSGTNLTLTLTVYTPGGGKVADTRTVTVVVP